MRRTRWLSAAALLAALGCGSDSTGPNGGNNNTLASEPLSAVINGVQWGSPLPQVVYSNNSILSVAGIDLAITASVGFAVHAPGAGVYSLTYQNPGAGDAIVTMGGKGWGTGLAGGTGTLTITTLTAHHVVGTFAFTAVPASGGATGNVTATNGKFDINY